MDTTWNSCNPKPLSKIYTLPAGCEEQQIDVGQCNPNPEQKDRCLHQDQFKEISQSQCLDEKSEYCCGAVTTEKKDVRCKSPGASDYSYTIPVTRKLTCGCVKCSSLQ